MPTSPVATRPHNAEAERQTLGALLIDGDRLTDVAAELKPDDFHDPIYRAVYQAMLRLLDEHTPVDFITLNEALKDHAEIQATGGTAFLAKLAENVPTTSNTLAYAPLYRRLINVGQSMTQLASSEVISAQEAIERAEQDLLALSRQTTGAKPQHIAEIGAASYDRYARLYAADDKTAFFGLRTGFAELDLLLTGLMPGHLMIVAARPSMGKTSFALDVARHAASEQHRHVAVFSLEMTKQELMDRIIAGMLGVETWKLKKGELAQHDFNRLGTIFDGLKNHPLFIDDDPDTTIANLRSKARRQQMEHGLDLLIIDYLQLIEVTDRASGENRTGPVRNLVSASGNS